jgi:predicted enzyme related to lactoylglutathione lyase
MGNPNTGRFVWYELMVNDAKAAIAFYTEVIGWKTQPFAEGGGDYTMWVGSQGPLGGVMGLGDAPGAMPCWMSHVQVEDVDAAAAQAKKLGGAIHKAPEDIPTVGRFAVIADPQGAMISLFKPNSDMTPHDQSKEGEFCWRELLTSDSNAAFAFYSKLFGWKVIQEMDMGPMGTYRIYGLGDERLGGMMTVPKGQGTPPMWLYYIEVSNLDAAIARAQKRGAKIMNGPMEVPTGARIVQLQDPQGVAIALHEPAK